MRSLPVLLAVLGGVAAFIIPAAAESDHGACVATSAAPPATIDLEAIPIMNTTGPKAVKGVGDDECGSVGSTEHGDEELGDSDD